MILVRVAEEIARSRPDTHFLFTSQTQTSADLLKDRLPPGAFHQMAPIDTPTIARRFITHWRPDLYIAAEGDIWPNLILATHASGTRLSLVNARMTGKSLSGWRRWPSTARRLFSAFDVITAADTRTADGLTSLSGYEVLSPGNLKSALPPPQADEGVLKAIQAIFIGERACFLAASTHPGEEELAVKAWKQLSPRPAFIIAPRHPERGDDIERLLNVHGLKYARRSSGAPFTQDTDVLLADTIGEMGLWYHLADTVYLGGGHAEGVGGHNPLEPARLGKRVLTGPQTFNFDDIMTELSAIDAVRICKTAHDLAQAAGNVEAGRLPAETVLNLEARSQIPLIKTLEHLLPLLPKRAQL